ncbi:MAG TPA: TlpA disulfide reductase family protein [Bryobacteraceae bacterium]|nr:TlpA disulfide reductase family protein [Bryobacteraceae bacterium]
MKVDRILPAALALMMVAFCGALYHSLHETVVNAGDTAPNFSITADSGRTFTARDFGGKLLLLNFWATWCGTCIDEIPALNAMSRELAPKGLVVLGVSVDKDANAYSTFLKRFPLAYQTARDPDEKINLSYGTIQYPESYLIDQNGKVIEKFISEQPWNSPQMIQHVESLL